MRDICYNVAFRKSVRKGYHIILWLDKPISNKNHFELRKHLGDDKFRIKLDKVRQRRREPINILFLEKTDLYYKRKKWKKKKKSI